MAAPSLFEFLKHIGEPKGDPSLLDDPEALKAYAPFIINRGIAQHLATVMFAAEANKRAMVDKEMHYGFLFHSIKKSKRYSKWAKKEEESDDVKLISEIYQISMERATEYAALIGKDGIAKLKEHTDKGGIVGRSKKGI